jgi:ribonuclease HI
MDKIEIYTDGSSRGNPGPGGYGAIIVQTIDNSRETIVKEIGGREEKTTNNRMEIKAAIESLKNTPTNSEATIHTDSAYLINGITKWVKGWQKNGWVTKEKNEVLNRDLWEELVEETSKRKVEWQKVAGHSGHGLNERCDEIATGFADGNKVELYNGPRNGYVIEESKGGGVNKSKNKGVAYSYVSMVKGVIQTHKTWGECKQRVDGVKGARFRKSLSLENEREIIALFQGERS